MEQGTSRLELLREEIRAGKLNRRSVLKRAMVMGLSAPVIASLLAACGDDEESEDEGSETEPTTAGGAQATEAEGEANEAEGEATDEPETGASPAGGSQGASTDAPGRGRGVAGLLRILYWQAPTILNTHFSQGTKDSAAAALVLEPLIDVMADGTLIPVLAAEVPSLENGGVAEDGLSVTYKLKEGVLWSDGEPFTAEDVRFTWEYVTAEGSTTTSLATYQVIESVEVIDELTARVNFIEPTPGWYSPFTTGFGGVVVPRHVLQDFVGEAARDAKFNLNPIGTGPYKVVDFRPGDTVIYEINENYREADKPYFQQIEFKGGGDATAAARAALQTGETDWGWNLQVEKSVLEPMAEGGNGVLLSNPAVSVERISVNFADPKQEVDGARSEPTTQHPFLSDLTVRQAFALGCDRETIATELYGPAGQATANLLVGPENLVSTNTTFEYNPEQGASLLDEAGWTLDGNVRAKDGVEMRVVYQTTINPLRQKTQEIVKQGWEQMGIPTELKSVDAAVFFSSDAGNPDTLSHFYADFQMFTNSPSVPYPIAYMASWKSNEPETDIAQQANNWSGSNSNRWVNEEYNTLYEQAVTELDPDRQRELFVAMNDLIVNEVVDIALVHRADVVGANANLKGYNPSPWTPDVRDIANWYFEE